jgi:hypothetical protein
MKVWCMKVSDFREFRAMARAERDEQSIQPMPATQKPGGGFGVQAIPESSLAIRRTSSDAAGDVTAFVITYWHI